jgi:hypothetical protein
MIITEKPETKPATPMVTMKKSTYWIKIMCNLVFGLAAGSVNGYFYGRSSVEKAPAPTASVSPPAPIVKSDEEKVTEAINVVVDHLKKEESALHEKIVDLKTLPQTTPSDDIESKDNSSTETLVSLQERLLFTRMCIANLRMKGMSMEMDGLQKVLEEAMEETKKSQGILRPILPMLRPPQADENPRRSEAKPNDVRHVPQPSRKAPITKQAVFYPQNWRQPVRTY